MPFLYSPGDKHLHIVCFDVPYPANYGGVFDLFYKIKTLFEMGVNIHLHCFEYGRKRQLELKEYCLTVNYYPRNKFNLISNLRLPYIVSSRADNDLLQNITKDNYPVLLEGIHCTYFLFTGQLKEKKIFVRLHNVEFEYYKELAKSTRNIFKKIYYQRESRLLKKYEMSIANKATFVAVSEKDKIFYEEYFSAKDIKYLPVFLPFNNVSCSTGIGNFCIYHGNLSVAENEKAIVWLLENIFTESDIPFVVAGKNSSKFLEKFSSKFKNLVIVTNPSTDTMADFIKRAQLHLLPSFNNTGIKIKLLNALFTGRFIITNSAAIEGSGLESLCEIANTKEEWQKLISQYFKKEFTEADINKRKVLLEKKYNNTENAKKLIQWIW